MANLFTQSNSRWWVAEGEDDYESSSSSATSEGVQRHLNDPLASSSGSQSSALFQKNHFEPELSGFHFSLCSQFFLGLFVLVVE